MNLELEIKEIKSKLSLIVQAQNKKVWGSVRWVQQLTGWNGKDLEAARNQGLVEWKDTPSGRLYNINSVPERLLKK